MGRGLAIALALLLLLLGAVPLPGQSRFTFSPYAGTLFVDGSCVYRPAVRDGCAGFDGPTLALGATASYELAPAWRVEATYARVSIGGHASATTPTSGSLSADDPWGVPFGTAATLAHLTIRRSLVGGERSDVFATGSIGRIAFDAGRENRSFADLLLGAGLGIRLGAGPVAVRSDARLFAQPCAGGEPIPDGLACDDGSWLTHAMVTGGVVLTFPGVRPPGGD